ncbi:hypothetical protein Q9R19_09240 [Microbacterium sp. ARD32]|uniref:hypothetical protein n=1 Tax=Microbacterium sp. ARD32 TaxID=2962577 RepID=UPI0028823F0C|nr:hypothetical protein [Microbacterium sp. ARD32]MDT0157807.1 hypothetical protein [Microbacterium sp. ARD32]
MLVNKQLQDLGLPPVIVRARNRHVDYYPLLEQYSKHDNHEGMTRLLALLLLESVHKRIALITSRGSSRLQTGRALRACPAMLQPTVPSARRSWPSACGTGG